MNKEIFVLYELIRRKNKKEKKTSTRSTPGKKSSRFILPEKQHGKIFNVVYVHTQIHTDTHTDTHTHTQTHIHTHTHIYIYVCMCVCVCVNRIFDFSFT